MSTNQIQAEGKNITLAAPSGGVVGGGVYVIGNLIGVAVQTAAQGENFVLCTGGVYNLPKKSADNISAAGTKVYWDTDPGEITVTASGNYLIGCATEIAGAATTDVNVRLDGIAVTAEA